ncbi:alanine racemase [Striga asiatica]|uniref:Alanine racemase n=1 Tax=Striga asiatica TaxID=4170 RepID=A0A5A7PD82_STRAF|nr:alanine racemase [Striga asiatica]
MAENHTAQDVSFSPPINSRHLIQSTGNTSSPAKSVAVTSLVSAIQAPIIEEDIVENNIQMVESTGMDIEKGVSPHNSLALVENHKNPVVPSLKTWKRIGSSKGRLQRASDPPLFIDQTLMGKRDREDINYGKSINIWEHPWVPKLPGFKPAGKFLRNPELL